MEKNLNLKNFTDINESFKDDANTIFICTQHDSHAKFVIKALEANKNIYVEKPLCLNLEQLKSIKKSYYSALEINPNLKFLVGYNRRFSPHVLKIKEFLDKNKKPMSFVFNINSGYIDKDLVKILLKEEEG